MSFLSPWYLLGALAVAVPLWVHLIRHERSTPLPFASLMFFRRIPMRTVSRRRLKYLLLLAARCLLVLLLALAFARPFFPRSQPPAALGAGGRLYLVAVDRSLSMHYGDRASRALAAARQVVDRMSAADEGQILAIDSEAHALNAPTRDRTTLRGLVEAELRPTALPGNLGAALGMMEKLARGSNKTVAAFLISDFQKTGLVRGPRSPSAAGALRLPAGSTLELIGVDDQARPNWELADLSLNRDTFQNRYPRRVQARVNGYHTPAARKELVLTLNGREVQRRAIDLPAAGSATVVFDPFELPPGPSRGELKLLPGDGLPQDDVHYFTLVRREPHRLLYLSGSESARELLYLREALAAGQDSPFVIESRAAGEAGTQSLRGFSTIVLSNLPALPGRLPGRLKEYVEEGGGLLVILGDRSNWPALARSLGALLPAKDAEKVYVRREREQFITLGDLRRDHFLFQPFSERAAGGLLSVRFFGYFRLAGVETDAGNAAVLARFSTGEPALVEKAAGRGRVLLLASAPDSVWSDFPLHAGFVPFMVQAARYLGAVREEPAGYTVPATVALDPFKDVVTDLRSVMTGQRPVTTINPSGRRVEATSSDETYVRLQELGFYEVRHHRTTDYLAANPDPRESDLTPLPAEDRALLAQHAPAEHAPAGSPTATTRRDREQQQNLWWALLVAATIVAAGESVLGNNHLKN